MIYNSNQYPTLMRNDNEWYEYDPDVGLDDIKKFVRQYHQRRKKQVCIHELGVDKYRFDFVSLDPYRQRVRILEYKVNKADFNGDSKHLGYMGYCHTFAFVTPLGLVTISDLRDKRAGLMYVFRYKKRASERDRWYLGAIWMKRPTGMVLHVSMYYHVIEMMLARLVQGRKEDFF